MRTPKFYLLSHFQGLGTLLSQTYSSDLSTKVSDPSINSSFSPWCRRVGFCKILLYFWGELICCRAEVTSEVLEVAGCYTFWSSAAA
jgi:hypothetical protein